MIFLHHDRLILEKIFTAQNLTFCPILILILISQTTQSKKYNSIIHDAMELVKTLKLKVQSKTFFDRTFFFLFLVKTLTNVVLGNLPFYMDSQFSWTIRADYGSFVPDECDLLQLCILWTTFVITSFLSI